MASCDNLEKLDKLLRYLRGLYGADKAYRLINYGCRVAANAAIQAGHAPDSKLVKVFRGIGGNVMMTRYAVRFWGILESVSALGHLRRQAKEGKITDSQQFAIETLQNLSLLFYYGMEHYCYINYAAPGTFDDATVGKCERISCGAWFVWILLEVAAIVKEYKRLVAEGKLTSDAKTDLLLRFIQMVCDCVLSVHWTLEKGIGLTDMNIGLIGFIGGVATAYYRWRNTA